MHGHKQSFQDGFIARDVKECTYLMRKLIKIVIIKLFMNSKQAKKLRQCYRRDVQKQAGEMANLIGNAMKPKPKFIPWKLWLWAAGFFIKIKK